MKENVLFIILVFAALAAGYYAGTYVTAEEWKVKFSQPSKRDTVTTTTYKPQPAQTESVKTKPPVVTPKHKIDADSIFNAGLQTGIDSTRKLFAYYTAPRETTVIFPDAGILFHQSDRLREMDVYTFIPAPVREVERIITDSVFVPTYIDDSWYDHWQTQVLTGALVLIVLLK